MKRLTHTELVAAHSREDWAVLWEQAIPLVKLVVGRMVRSGAIRADEATSDLLQQGYLFAGEHLRTWRPLECAFTTHVVTGVKRGLRHWVRKEANGGISRRHGEQHVMLSLEEPLSPDAEADVEDDTEAATISAALVYEGVIRPGAQFDGEGDAPAGLGDPLEEADRAINSHRLNMALQHLPAYERAALEAIYGLNEVPQVTAKEYATKTGVALRTVERDIQNARAFLAVYLGSGTN